MVDGESATIILLDMWDNKVLLFVLVKWQKKSAYEWLLISKVGIFWEESRCFPYFSIRENTVLTPPPHQAKHA